MPTTPATRPRAAPAARRPPPPARRPPPPAARRVREDSDWREELATRKVPPGTGKGLPGKEGGGKENEDFLFVPDDGTPSADAVEDLYSLDGGWSVELVTEEEEGESWTAGPEYDGPRVLRRAPASAAPSTPFDPLADLEAAPPNTAMGSIPRHVLRTLLAAEADAADAASKNTATNRRRLAAERKTHTRLVLIGGSARGARLLSGRGETTRPMMEKVRAALFDMLLSHSAAGTGTFPPDSTWLDLFAGTGSVGLEALSRGAAASHFVEMDPWVVDTVLKPNIATVEKAGAQGRATVVASRAEDFVKSFSGAPFDYVSICPPYLKVDYQQLLADVASSGLVHGQSVVVVEYPIRSAGDVPPSLGPLARVRDRRYGRTNVVVYGPAAE